MRDQKEIFKKQRLPVDELDMDSLHEVSLPKMNKTMVVKKHKRHSHSKHAHRRSRRHSHKHSYDQSQHTSDLKNRENLKFIRRKEKLITSCSQTFPIQPEAATERKSLITKNRLTRCVGIYNKGKTSDTIYRERIKSTLFNKASDRLKEKTNEDMSKVLDCSSFQIRPLNVIAAESFEDFDQDTHSVASSSHSEHQRTFSLTSTSPPKREVHSSPASVASTVSVHNQEKIRDFQAKVLPLKTPLMEITKKLLNSLEPAETFGRDYLQEVRDELKSYYRRSSSMLVNSDAEDDVSRSTSTPTIIAVTPVGIGSKSNPSRKLFLSSIGKIENMSRKSAQAMSYDDHENHSSTPMVTDVKNEEIVDRGRLSIGENERQDMYHIPDRSQFLPQNNLTCYLSQPLATKEQLVTIGCIPDDQLTVKNCPPYDILSMVDHDLRCTDEVGLLHFSSPIYSEISPLKKPSLEIPTPPEKLLPRKLF